MNFTRFFGKGLRPLPRVLALGAMALPLSACDLDDILSVRDPELVSPGELENPESVPGLYNGALRSFFIAYSGAGDDSFLSTTGVFSDEMYTGDTFTTRIATDQREQFRPVQGNTSDAAYSRLQLARTTARRAASAAERFGVGNAGAASLPGTLATLRAIEGYTYVALGEAFCGNIPFSQVAESGPIDPLDQSGLRPGISTQATFDSAAVRFASARTAQPTNNLARVGHARALLNGGNFAAALEAASGVPMEFVFRIQHSTNSGAQANPIWALQGNGRYGVANDEGGEQRPDQLPDGEGFATDEGEGLAFRAYQDPRVVWYFDGGAFAGGVNLFRDGRYFTQDADVPLASGVEARLIVAEALNRSGNYLAALDTLNALRARASELIPLLYPNIPAFLAEEFPQTLEPLLPELTPEAQVDQIFRERALWLYMTGHRMGDLRRLVRQYGRDQADVFPSGPYFRAPGAFYGNDVAFPIPFNEENNTQYDPAACNVDQA